MMTPRAEYPNPHFARDNWESLNGEWEFSFDEPVFDRTIIVPFAFETKLSGIGVNEFHKTVWYRRTFHIPHSMKDKLIILHFGAVDYRCRVWVNDRQVAEHVGGQVGFSTDITEAIQPDKPNVIRVMVEDDPLDLGIPRGKQYWEKTSKSIFYTKTTGIWQSVWLEAVSSNHLKNVYITPLLDEKAVKIDYELAGEEDLLLVTRISYKDTRVAKITTENNSFNGSMTVNLEQPALRAWNFVEDLTWSPENPRLFDVVFSVYHKGELADRVASYFGMRKVSVDNGLFMLNNRPYYQKLVLDQGYWPESLLTAPSDQAFIDDILLAKQMGFNGARKHQKVEDPRYLYHADRLGFLVWGEIGAAYIYSRNYAATMTREWSEAVLRDYNHPSIVAWTPLNESWGILQVKNNPMEQGHCSAMYHLTKSLDDTRVVIDNDGWEHTCGDLLTIHDYEWRSEVLKERYSTLERVLSSMPADRPLYVKGYDYNRQPVLVTEFGGISFITGDENGWGYSTATAPEDFLKRYEDVVAPLLASPVVQGFCYTQLTDVEQEKNGLLNYDRSAKVDLEAIKRINEGC